MAWVGSAVQYCRARRLRFSGEIEVFFQNVRLALGPELFISLATIQKDLMFLMPRCSEPSRKYRVSLYLAPLSLLFAAPVAHATTLDALVNPQGRPSLFTQPKVSVTASSRSLARAYADPAARARALGKGIFAAQGEANDRFGASLDRSGDTLVVGAWGAFGGEGLAYVSTLGAAGWSAPVELVAPSEGGDNFGWSVATDGTSIGVGARLASEPDSIDEPLYETGAITFFERGNRGWEATQRLYSSGRDEDSAFGFSMAMQDGVALVGEPGADDVVRDRNESGAAYIFTRDASGQWTEAQRLVAPDAASDDVFGLRVALSKVGSRSFAFVSALGRDDRGSASGAVYVFEQSRAGAAFSYKQKLVASDGKAQDQFGFSISASQGRLLVGAPGVDVANAPDVGAAYAFELGSSGWSQRARIVPGAGRAQERFGYQVAIGAAGFAASRFPDLGVEGASRGVSVYERVSSSEYRLEGIFNPPDVDGKVSFGGALSYAQGTVLVGMEAGVNANGAASGSVEVFEISALPAPLGGLLSLGGLGLGLLALGRRRSF